MCDLLCGAAPTHQPTYPPRARDLKHAAIVLQELGLIKHIAEVRRCFTAGATIQAIVGNGRPSVLNISMNVFDGEIASGGIAGVRLDLPAATPHQFSGSYPQLTSYFFYQSGASVGFLRPHAW